VRALRHRMPFMTNHLYYKCDKDKKESDIIFKRQKVLGRLQVNALVHSEVPIVNNKFIKKMKVSLKLKSLCGTFIDGLSIYLYL
jgi:hypothetical protein